MSRISFAQLINIEQTRRMLEAHYRITRSPSFILDNNWNVLCEVGRPDICTRFHLVHPEACRCCMESRAGIQALMQGLEGEYRVHVCGSSLRKAAMPIIIAGEHLATFVTGPYLDHHDRPEPAHFRQQAQRFGFDVRDYLEALERVPVFTGKEMDDLMGYYRSLVVMMSDMGLKNLELAREVKERELVEDALNESEQRLHATIQGSSIPMFAVGTDRRIIYWNKALEKLSGRSAMEMIGNVRAWEPFYEHERPLLANLLAEGKSRMVPFWYTGRYLKSGLLDEAYEGTDFFPRCGEGGKWLHFTAAALRDTKGNLIGAVETLEDVTEREVAEAKWRTLYNSLPGGSFTVNNNYVIEDVNDLLCTVTGFTREELVGQRCGIICPKGPHLCPIFDMGKDSIDNDETAVKAKDGRLVPIIKSARRIPAGDREIIVENFQDITDRKQLEEQLRHAQKMEAVGRLAGGVAHDFNNLLTAIIGYANLLELKLGKNNPLAHYAGRIISSANRGASLTGGLLAFSRRHIVDLKPVRIDWIIAKAEELLSRLVPEDIELRIAAGQSHVVLADSLQMEQILMNLVTNARDAMPAGGLLTIRTELMELGEDSVRSHGYGQPGKVVCISVSDTGIGIGKEARERIFEPFFTTKEVGKGTGLGLSIVYGIIRRHNGFIDVISEPGSGTTVNVYLPLTMDPPDEIKESAASPQPRGTETILLAEDHPTVREMARVLLEEFGYGVVEAEDGVEALEKFRQHGDGIGLLVLDVIMPRKNGKEVYDEIRRMRPDVEALFMSGYTDDILTGRGLIEENLNFISKPLMQSTFLSKVREILDVRAGAGIS